jgi:integrase
LRHTHASWLITYQRATLRQVQIRLGHESHSTTERYYIHLMPGHSTGLINGFGAWLDTA